MHKVLACCKNQHAKANINQTQHKIFLELNGKVGILTPCSKFSKEIKTDVLLLEAVIVGEVPGTYYNLPGIEDHSDTFNFIE